MSASRLYPNGPNFCDRCDFVANPFDSRNKVWYCPDCISLICDSCWPGILPAHEIGRTRYNGLSHEKVEPVIHQKLHDVLHPTLDEEELNEQHRADAETTWFGTVECKRSSSYH